MADLSIFQKAACESIWRALSTRGEDKTDQLLTCETPKEIAKERITHFVREMPYDFIADIVVPEISQFGRLPGGYSQRWAGPSAALIDYQARQAALANHRVSDNAPWEIETSASSCGHRYDPAPPQSDTALPSPEDIESAESLDSEDGSPAPSGDSIPEPDAK